jgi:hypothetical protein
MSVTLFPDLGCCSIKAVSFVAIEIVDQYLVGQLSNYEPLATGTRKSAFFI